jgi:hypothetical protein
MAAYVISAAQAEGKQMLPTFGLFLGLVFGWIGLPGLAVADSSERPASQPTVPSATTPEDPSEHHEITPNCRAEVKQLCRGILPGGGRIKKCIEANENKLSPACRTAVQERLEEEDSKRK